MAAAARSSIRSDVIAAYRAFADGDHEPLIAACAERVEWVETIGARIVESIEGRDAVASRLDDAVIGSRRIVLRAISVDDLAVSFEFVDPWWDENRGWLRRAATSVAGVTFKQYVTFGNAIERIVCAQQLAAAPDTQDLAAFSMLLGR